MSIFWQLYNVYNITAKVATHIYIHTPHGLIMVLNVWPAILHAALLLNA